MHVFTHLAETSSEVHSIQDNSRSKWENVKVNFAGLCIYIISAILVVTALKI